MFHERRVSRVLALILFFASRSIRLSAASDCAPYPVRLDLKNVTLGNTTARGVSLSVGSPEQSFAFLPQWPLNSTFVYGTDGHCTESWSKAACRTFRGGTYDSSASATYQEVSSDLTEAPPYSAFIWGKDKLLLNSNITLPEFPIGIAQSDFGTQGYHPQVAFGLGRSSVMLNSLYTAGHIASRSWSMFWGRTGGTRETQQDGSFVFGGFDRSKASGKNYTSVLNYSSNDCSTGMLVTITDIALNFPNGTTASLFDGMRSSAISACLVPDFPVLMTLPREPYFKRFESFTDQTLTQRTFGVYYYGVLYPNSSSAYTGDLTITFNSGLSVRVPNDQLVVPTLTINKSTGSLLANGSSPELLINPIQHINKDDLPLIGRQFLSSAYLMVNQDANTFTLWNAAPNKVEDLVAIDRFNRVVDSHCDATSSPAPIARDDEDHKMSNGVIAGIVIGSVAGVAIIAAGVFFLLTKRRRLQQTSGDGDSYPATGYTDHLTELGPSARDPYIPYELPAKPSPPRRFELP
ncbi:aspartic peptidase domain-containing protein [Aspergillus coremiiformis]|uniref:Aspartic peptidase domain-containing protein n=1 Tax=Aspergillus coremiiformis TaxID=138285 RepID=A0A5N6YSV1_9EURO|nr:aspartic peptidase domain-containing protein [Aspergillus coremiiformis]